MIKLRSGNIIIITLLECMNAEDTLLDCNLLEHTKGEKFMGEERERERANPGSLKRQNSPAEKVKLQRIQAHTYRQTYRHTRSVCHRRGNTLLRQFALLPTLYSSKFSLLDLQATNTHLHTHTHFLSQYHCSMHTFPSHSRFFAPIRHSSSNVFLSLHFGLLH